MDSENSPDKGASPIPAKNATFYVFKSRGKYYTHERGVMPNVFSGEHTAWTGEERRAAILRANGNFMPGMSTTAANMRVVVILDDHVDFGFPLCLEPIED